MIIQGQDPQGMKDKLDVSFTKKNYTIATYIIIIIIIIIIINIQGWAIWLVPSPELQLLSPSFLRSPNCSLSLWAVVVWF
jgi:hypothetical protein